MCFSLKLWCLQYGILYCWGDLRGDTDDCTTVWKYFVWLYSYVGHRTFLDTIGRHFLITTALLYLSIGPAIYMKQLGSERGVSRSHICHSPVLWAVAYTAYSCGSMWNQNWAPPVNCALAEDPGVYLGKKYISCWNNRFLRVPIYIYIWFRTTCCYLTNGTFAFPWSARLGMPSACCSFLMFYCIHFCLYIPIFSYRCC